MNKKKKKNPFLNQKQIMFQKIMIKKLQKILKKSLIMIKEDNIITNIISTIIIDLEIGNLSQEIIDIDLIIDSGLDHITKIII